MARKLGLLAINPAFIPAHNEQVYRYGLQQRTAGIRAMEANISDYMEAFTSPAKKSELQAIFDREARRLIEGGADVIVPTGGIPMMLFGKEPNAQIDGAPIVNGVTVVIKAAEMAVKLKRLGVPAASRTPQSGFALPSAQTIDEFLRHIVLPRSPAAVLVLVRAVRRRETASEASSVLGWRSINTMFGSANTVDLLWVAQRY
jgi:hypothetical protein